jgi:hypothetical protein
MTEAIKQRTPEWHADPLIVIDGLEPSDDSLDTPEEAPL